jgi:phosphoribosylamine---glycine ligase
MRVLVLGSGGREHAFAWKISQSKNLDHLFIAPGNPGTASCGTNVNLSVNDFDSIGEFVIREKVNLVVVGPEDPLVNGIADYFENKEELRSVGVVGPHKNGARLEGSKEFAKEFMIKHQIPTARYESFGAGDLALSYDFLGTLKPPFVLKADGLAGGKGVVIPDNIGDAKREMKEMLEDQKFGAASSKVVIEEFLKGIEMSVFVITDGESYKILPEAKDYKRIGEGDVGLNTGGMGAVSPVPFVDDVLMKKIEDRIVRPSVEGIKKDELKYKGFLFIGLMIVDGEPFVIEYNVRMGDPETEVVLPRIKSDLLSHLNAITNGKLEEEKILIDERTATTIMLVSQGYPEAYEKGKVMTGLDQTSNCILFHAGTAMKDSELVTNGGRVMAVTTYGNNMNEALALGFDNVQQIVFDGKNYRKDIGVDLM